MTNDVVFNWAYARHNNVLSWYIRPLFIIPIVLFAFKRSLMSLTVPLFFIGLVMAAWKRNWKWLLGVIIAAALLKIFWSIVFSGEAGMSILKPAITGLLICIGGIYYYKKRHIEKKK